MENFEGLDFFDFMEIRGELMADVTSQFWWEHHDEHDLGCPRDTDPDYDE